MFFTISASGRITLPRIFADHMVLQREQPLTIWGTAGSNETVKVVINGQRSSAASNQKGNGGLL
ncbi:hypothetical protein KRR40_32995 [Niabella defluvii]|nr:hypothetical protein KRR40_32995 [Niabella sp. I65]